MNSLKVGLMGLGTVGTGVVRLIRDHQEDLQRQIGSAVEVAKILVRDKSKVRNIGVDARLLTEEPADILLDPDIDIVIEVMGGVEQTKQHLLTALEHKKHVITANKDLMALHGPEILRKAAQQKCDVMYEASVAGGIPILRTLVDGLSADRITKIMGIVNGTTNYILSKMSQDGAEYDEVLQEAMRLGYAEADPTSDVEGLDAAYKMVILGTLGFRMNVTMEDTEVRGITHVTKEDILYGKRLGYEVKLLGIAERQGDLIRISVEPTMVKNTHPLASVDGVNNAVYVYGEAVGETMYYGPGAGEMPTATSVVSDLVAVARNVHLGVSGARPFAPYNKKKLMADDQTSLKCFLLLRVQDKAGVLYKITEVFSKHDVSLEAVLQQPTTDHSDAEITIITHDATKAGINQVLQSLKQLDCVYNIKSLYRVEG